ncbi:hypothetical protein MM236_00820 [Belliella sp. DSM 107340]|uniref:Uncharacterized protein n=1 Tax=Belliella calami TaxID=2923436 RepID=A0ABS9UIR0_9BACT|nr:hypothetical protein [Belliella calami]MCH7396502.1 hypothetical protein [Belliella calami]
MEEEKINSLLDKILDFKKTLYAKTEKLWNIIEGFESLTWFDNLDEESLMLMNDLISSAKDLRMTLIRQYLLMDSLRKKSVAKDEIKAFKEALDELKVACEDLESVFFFLPEMPGFVETTKKLSLV